MSDLLRTPDTSPSPGTITARPSRLLRVALAGTGIALATATTACNGLGGGDQASSTTRTANTTGASGTTAGTTGGDAQPRDPALDDRHVVASRVGGFDDTTIRIDVLSLRRDGNLATLRFTATNTTPGTVEDTSKEWSIFTDLGTGPTDYTVGGVYLVDPKHSKRYPVAKDSADDCVCSSTSGVDVLPTASREFSATFAAPPADVSSIDVYVPGAGTFENVPVS